MLQAGLSPGEALGYVAERKLHDRQQDILIFRLRDLFPLRDPRDDAAIETRLSDGLLFLNANIDRWFRRRELADLRALQDDLRQEFDTLSDIVLAEATHLRAMGRTDAANAWLQVLSGETIPGLSERAAHASRRPWIDAPLWSFSSIRSIPTPTRRRVPSPSRHSRRSRPRFFGSFEHRGVEVTIAGGDGSRRRRGGSVLRAGLGLAPIDVLVGGESEVVLRARHRL